MIMESSSFQSHKAPMEVEYGKSMKNKTRTMSLMEHELKVLPEFILDFL